ncbi:MAG: OmpA family protein [Candidatus Methylomirabilota bacterium]
MKGSMVVVACGVLLVFLTSCASSKKSLLVLQSDADGRTGEIVVANQGGSQVLVRPGDATEVKDGNSPPSAPFRVEEAEIAKTFGPALAAQPPPPVHYVLYFRTGSTDLVAESEKQIAQILKNVKARQSTDIRIVGHTDRVGKREGNYTLGLDRAQQIKGLLVSKGVDPAFIEVESHGEDNPLIPTDNEASEPRNRRVEVTVK